MKQNIKPEKTGYASVDKPWLEHYDYNLIRDEIPSQTIYSLAYDMNKNNLGNVALDVRMSKNDFKQGLKVTYRDLFNRSRLVAKALKELGVKDDEIIPLIVPNVPEARYFIYGNSYLGSTSYPISPLMPANDLERIIKENGIKNLVVFDYFYEKYKNVIESTNLNSVITLDGMESLPSYIKNIMRLKKKSNSLNDNVLSYDEFVRLGRKDSFSAKEYDPNHNAAIIGTSGTTGSSKGVCLSDKNINAVALAYYDGQLFEGTMLDALIPSIGYGISMVHYQTVSGKYVYLIPELLTDKFPRALEVLKPNNFPGGPVHYINLKASNINLSKLPKYKNYISGGASLPADVESSLNKVENGYVETSPNLDLVVRQGFGLSENTALGSYSKIGAYKFGSIGIPLPYETVAIFEPNTDKELKYGERGEICITGEAMMREYLNNPEETNKVLILHSDGKKWIHTKDIGYMDEDGNIFHVDRIKNIFMRKGFNVHPSKIADFLDSIYFVKNSTVIGFDDPQEQAVPVAFIELDAKYLDRNIDELKDELKIACYESLEETSIPVDFVFVDKIPVNLGGKIDNNKIKKEANIDFSKSKNVPKTLKFTK